MRPKKRPGFDVHIFIILWVFLGMGTVKGIKRGPPKGYLSAREQRLHDAEALLGVIISSPDPRATTMVQDLSKDSLAAAIISRVTNSTFGLIGRNALQHHDSNTNTRRRSIDLRNQEIDWFDG